MGDNRLSFRATISREGEEWVAHCLDLDLVTTAKNPDLATDRLAEAIGIQLGYARTEDNFAYLFRPAPQEAWDRLGRILEGPHRTIVRPIKEDSDRFVSLEAQLSAA